MKFILILTIFLYVYPATSEVFKESCECEKRYNTSNTADNYRKLLHLNSIIYDLTNIASGIDFETNRCKEELMLIKEGVGKKDVWAFKRKYLVNCDSMKSATRKQNHVTLKICKFRIIEASLAENIYCEKRLKILQKLIHLTTYFLSVEYFCRSQLKNDEIK